MIPRALLLFASLLLAPVADAALPWQVSSRTLDNGLTVHVVPMPSPGVAAWYTWVGVGSRDEVAPGSTGMAHFFEHLLFYGSAEIGLLDRERALLRMGVEENAWTWVDETVYHAVLPVSQLDAWSRLEADRFRNLHLTPDDVRREAGAVYGELRKGRADPEQRLYEALMGRAFDVHPYRHDTIGYEDDIAAMPDRYDDALAFHQTWYRPEHIFVVVVGDVEPEQVFATVARDWEGWQPPPGPEPVPVPEEPEPDGPRRIGVTHDGPAAARLAMAWRIPAHDADRLDVAALEVAADLLLAPDGPLRQRLVRDAGLAWSVEGGRDAWVDPGLFRVEVVLSDPAHLAAAEIAIREEIGRLADGIDPARLERARTRARYALLTSLDDPDVVALLLGQAARRTGDPSGLFRFLAQRDAVDAEALSDAVRTWLVDERLTVATLAGTAPPQEAP